MRISFAMFRLLFLAPQPHSSYLLHCFYPNWCTEYGALKPKRREGGGDLASRLHMSKAVRHDTKDGNNWKSVSDQEPAIPHEHTETESPMVQMTRL